MYKNNYWIQIPFHCGALLLRYVKYHSHINKINRVYKEFHHMVYKKPEILAKSTTQMAQCRPNSKPSGRPCNPPGPSGR